MVHFIFVQIYNSEFERRCFFAVAATQRLSFADLMACFGENVWKSVTYLEVLSDEVYQEPIRNSPSFIPGFQSQMSP